MGALPTGLTLTTGTETLTGTNTYTGTTAANAGVLILTNASAMPSANARQPMRRSRAR